MGKIRLTLQTKILLLVCTVVAIALLVVNIMITKHVTGSVQNGLRDNAVNIARMMAHSPTVIDGLSNPQHETVLQTFANEMRQATNVQFIVVFDMQGIRKSHPSIEEVGQHIVGGDEQFALAGREYVSVAEGTLGHSLRAFAPIYAPGGEQVGAVVVGILLDDMAKAAAESRQIVYFATVLGMAIGVMGALLLAHNIKKILFGLEPFAIARLLEERSAMLQSVREGIIAVDNEANITLVNHEALRILTFAGVEGDLLGKPVEDYVPNSRLKEVMQSGQAELDREQDMNGVVILTNRLPILVNGKIAGAIATFRDKTEVRKLAEELTGVRAYVEALRSQTHEFMNKLHVVLGLVRLECYDQVVAYISQVVHQQEEEVDYIGSRIREPALAGFLLSKLSRARELNVELNVTEGSYLPKGLNRAMVHDLVTIIGNLIDNAFDAVTGCTKKQVLVSINADKAAAQLTVFVSDSGPGVPLEQRDQIFESGFSTKAKNRGLGLMLVKRSVAKLGGQIQLSETPEHGAQFIVLIPYACKGDKND